MFRLRLLLLAGLFASLATTPKQAHSAPTETKIVTAPIIINGKKLFEVQGILSFPAEARAHAIAKRTSDLSRVVTFDPQTISIADSENVTDILAGDLVLMSVTDADARLTGEPRESIAKSYADLLRDALIALRKAYSIKSLSLGGLYALLATALLALILRLMGFLFPKFYSKIDSWRGTVIPSLRIQNFELLPSDRIADFAIGFARFIHFALALVFLYFYIYFVLGFFPWTRAYSGILFGYIIAPLHILGVAVLAYLPNLFFIGIILLVARYIIKFTRVLFLELGKGTVVFSGFHREWAEPTYKIVRFMMLAITAIATFPYLPGAKSPAFQGISIFLGVLLSLGSSSAVANIVAGVILTYMRAFKLGDRVQIADTVGDVTEVSLLVTRIRTIKNVEVTIANSMVLSSHIINFSGSAQQEGLILHTTVTIGYDEPWRKIYGLLIEAALATEDILRTPAPFVFQTALDDFYVHYQINAYTDQPAKMAKTYSDLHQNIQDKFFEAGVEIMSSHYSTLREGNRVAIPDDYLPKDYKAPSFRVGVEKQP